MTSPSTPTNATSGNNTSTSYEIRVSGHLDDHWSAMLGDLALTRRDDGTTSLTGPIADQAQLHGVLARIRDLGVPLLSLRVADPADTPTAGPAPRPALARPVRTERLTLRPATAYDAEATWAYRRVETVGQWLTKVPTDLEAYRATFADPHRLAATVIIEHDGAVIGDVMLRIQDAWAQAEVGWVLDPAHTGHGFATEAARALLGYCFEELGVHRVIATCFLANDTSRRHMERLGLRPEGHAVADSLHRSKQRLDALTYALFATEWPN